MMCNTVHICSVGMCFIHCGSLYVQWQNRSARLQGEVDTLQIKFNLTTQVSATLRPHLCAWPYVSGQAYLMNAMLALWRRSCCAHANVCERHLIRRE